MGKCHMGRTVFSSFCSLDIVTMSSTKIISSASLLLVLCVLTPESAPAPTPGGGGFFLEDLFLYNPLLGLGLGVAGGVLAKGVAGLAAAGAVGGKINTLVNVANAKINLINLGSSLVEGGTALLGGGSETTTPEPSPQYRTVYRNYQPRYRQSSYGK